LRIIISIFLALLAMVLVATPVLAQLSISPGSIDIQVGAGLSALPSIDVGNGSDEPMDFRVELAGYGQGVGGGTEVLEPDSNPLSAVSYISFDPAEFHLEPGQKQTIDLSVSIPEQIDGGRYAIVLVVSSPTGGPIQTISRLGVPIRLTIAGSHFDRKGAIESIETGSIESNKPIPIEVTYASQGNVHYKVQMSTTVTNASGDVLGNVVSEYAMVLPGYSREVISEWIPEREMEPGMYNVLVTASLEDDTILDQAQGSFEVSQAYVPPVPTTTPVATSPASITSIVEGNKDSSSTGVGWPMVGGIVGGVIIVGLLVYFLVRKRAYQK
jgi:hypothetical protein